MAKDPAFLFYPGDWVGGTMHLNLECKGAYFELLMLQFHRGHMTIDMIGQALGQSMERVWPKISDKFETDGEVYWNKRLRSEKAKREKYTESRRNNKAGKNQYTKDVAGDSGHMTSYMENANENIDNKIKESRTVGGDDQSKATLQDVMRDLLADELWVDSMAMTHKGKDLHQAIKESYDYMHTLPGRLATADLNDWKRLVQSFLSKMKPAPDQQKKATNTGVVVGQTRRVYAS